MITSEYARLEAQIAVLKEIAEEYPGQDNREHHRSDESEKKRNWQ